MNLDLEYLRICESLAEAAARKGNPGVGSIVVHRDAVIAWGEEATASKGDITCHAELEAVRMAVAQLGKDLSECVLYSTHEPCVMCAYAIRYHRIGKVCIRTPADYFGSVRSEFALLTTPHVPPGWSAPPLIEWISPTD